MLALTPATSIRYRRAKVLDSHGGPVVLAQVYEGAGGGRTTRGMPTSNIGPNVAQYDVTTLRSRIRHLFRNDPRLRKAILTTACNIAGTHIKPQSLIENEQIRKGVHLGWFDWSNQADADHRTDVYGFWFRAVQQWASDGEGFVRLRVRRPGDVDRFGNPFVVPLQLQLLEADMVPVTDNRQLENGNRVIQGIEFDRIGRVVAYHMYRQHPGDSLSIFGTVSTTETVRIPAEEVLHIFWPDRAGQVRGIPPLASIIARAHGLDVYDDAQLARQRAAAAFVGVLTSDTDEETGPAEALHDDGTETAPTLESGTVFRALPGESFTTTTPPSMGDDYEAFKQWSGREMAGGAMLTYEQLTGDMSNATYSSSRVSLLEFRRYAECVIHHLFAFQLCQAVYEKFLRLGAQEGAFALPGAANPQTWREYRRVAWMPQGWEWVDPAKEAAAIETALRIGITSHQAEIANRGDEYEQVMQEREEHAARGGVMPSDAPAPAAPADEDEDEDEDESPQQRRMAARVTPLRRVGT